MPEESKGIHLGPGGERAFQVSPTGRGLPALREGELLGEARTAPSIPQRATLLGKVPRPGKGRGELSALSSA